MSEPAPRLTDDRHVARRWVEQNFPGIGGVEKARLMLAYGAGMDRGMAEISAMVAAWMAEISAMVAAS
jgi:hypothetical protein